MGVGERVGSEVVAAYADCWNEGHPDGAVATRFTGPVLIMSGASDGFVTAETLAVGVRPRFPGAHFVAIEGSGHWPHAEQPAAVAAQLSRFITFDPASAVSSSSPVKV